MGGWLMTIRELMADVPTIKTSIEERINQAAEGIQSAQGDPGEQIDEISDAIEALKAGYEAEKLRQQETPTDPEPSYEQEDITP